MDFIETFNAISTAMADCSFWRIDSIVPKTEIDKDRLKKEPCVVHVFDHEYVDQSGPGIAGDDYHGFVYLPIEPEFYVKVEYAT